MLQSHFQASAVSDAPLDAPLPRCILRGSLDPITGIFYKAPEHHARMRTLQACDKCRIRKAKCSGDRPVCERCRTRGLTCDYAPERRARRWIKPSELDSRDCRSVPIPPSLSPPRTTDVDHYNGQAREAVQPGHATVPSPLALDIQPVTTRSPAVASDDAPCVEEDTLAISYASDPQAALFQPILSSLPMMSNGDAGHVALANHDPAYIDRGLTAAGCPERRVPYPVLFHHSLRPHPSGPPFHVDDQSPLSYPSSVDSPGRSHSDCTSLTASPVLTRPSSRGLQTPISSYPSSPFALASLSPTLVCDPHAYPLFSTELISAIDQGPCGTWADDMTWCDGASVWEGNTFLDVNLLL